MANHPSAAKRNRQRLKRTLRNRKVRNALRTAVKKARVAIDQGAEDAAALAKAAEQALRKAASKGVIHAGHASRTTSRIATQLARSSKS